jgi:salicylate hydroxylase
MYEKVCVGNKREDAQDVFFEGMLLKEGLGMHVWRSNPM